MKSIISAIGVYQQRLVFGEVPMLEISALFLTVVSVEDESNMFQLVSIMSAFDGKHLVKYAPIFRLVTPLVHLSVDGYLPE